MRAIILLTLVVVTTCVQLPPDFQKCNRKDLDFKQCVLKAAQHGISLLEKPYRELNLPSLNPFELTEVSINGGDGPVSLKQNFKDCKLFGLQTIKLDNFEFDFDKNEMRMSGIIPEVQKVCKYQIKGQILLLRIDGRGNSTITLRNLKVTDTLKFEETKKKSKSFLRFTSSSVTLDPELVIYNFSNSDDKTLSDNINPVLNKNWREVFDDVKGGYMEMIDRVLLSFANGFFSKVSAEEAFD